MEFHWLDLFWLSAVFCLGACVGSFLNVVVARLPLEKSLIWPGSRCGSCYQPIRSFANLPILGYLLLRGRCGTCGSRFSSRYMWVELATALGFVGIYCFDIRWNMADLEFVRTAQFEIAFGWVPWRLWVLFGQHAVLLSLLIAASLCDLDGRVIPLPLTISGTLLGLLLSTLFPWPWPNLAAPPADPFWFLPEANGHIPRGITNWPFWGPLPDGLSPGSWQLGLLTGLAGAVAGNVMMRTVKFVFEQGMGREALGLGDADLMMMAGAFLGWQLVVVGFFIGTFAALFLAIPMLLRSRERALPFGPGLAIGIMITLLGWHWIGPEVQPFFFEWITMIVAATLMGGGMFIASLMLRRRG